MGLFHRFLSESVLLAYRKATDFCILILYPATLLKEFMISNSFLQFLGSLRYRIMLSANRDSLTSSSPVIQIGIKGIHPFISCSCLIALARNSKTMLSRSGESEQPCLIIDFKGNGFSCSPFSMISSG
jgi:hypothetical protein